MRRTAAKDLAVVSGLEVLLAGVATDRPSHSVVLSEQFLADDIIDEDVDRTDKIHLIKLCQHSTRQVAGIVHFDCDDLGVGSHSDVDGNVEHRVGGFGKHA